MQEKEKEVKHEIIAKLGTLSVSRSGWQKELNLVSWNGEKTKYDIRQWSSDHKVMSKGISLSREEAEALRDLLNKCLPK